MCGKIQGIFFSEPSVDRSNIRNDTKFVKGAKDAMGKKIPRNTLCFNTTPRRGGDGAIVGFKAEEEHTTRITNENTNLYLRMQQER